MKLKEKKAHKLSKQNGTKLKKSKVHKKSKNECKIPETEVLKKVVQNDAKTQLELLSKFLRCDHVLNLTFGVGLKKSEVKDKFKFLVEHAFAGGLNFPIESWSKQTAFLGVEVQEAALGVDLAQGNVVIGPEADNAVEVEKFHAIWEKPSCQLRRFQDGKIRESVLIENENGPAYFTLAKLKKLLTVHFPGTKVTIHQFNKELLGQCYVADKEKEKLRATTDKLVHYLQEISLSGSLPLRQVRAHCDCLHSGDRTHGHYVGKLENLASKVASDNGGYMYIKEKAKLAPAQTQPIDILLEITLKDRLSTQLFARMRMTYVLALKGLLVQNNLKCMVVRDSDLCLIFRNVLYRIRVQGPNSILSNEPRNPWKLASLSEFLNRVGSPNPSWPGLCKLTRQWASDSGFELAFPKLVLDLIAASLFFDGGAKVPPLLGPTSSIEKAFLCFLHKLSFTDFSQVAIFLTAPEEFDATSFSAKFGSDKRSSYPAICIVTPFDVTPSSFTRDVDLTTLTRLVNCARRSLHAFTSHLPDITFSINLEVFYNTLLTASQMSSFDIILTLKHLQIPSTKPHADTTENTEKIVVKSFPVSGYDPLENFVNEARESFGLHTNFYFNRSAHALGIKFVTQQSAVVGAGEAEMNVVPNKPLFDPHLMLEDLTVLGRGLIKDVQINFQK